MGQTVLPFQQYPEIQLQLVSFTFKSRFAPVGHEVHWVLMKLQVQQVQQHLTQQSAAVMLYFAGQVVEQICISITNLPATPGLIQARILQWMAQQLRYLKSVKVRNVVLVHMKNWTSLALSTLNSPSPNMQLQQLNEAGLNVETGAAAFMMVLQVPKSMKQVQFYSSLVLSTTMMVISMRKSRELLVTLSSTMVLLSILALTKYENSLVVFILKDITQGATTALAGSVIVVGLISIVVILVLPGVSSNGPVKLSALLMKQLLGRLPMSAAKYMQQSRPKVLPFGFTVMVVLKVVLAMNVMLQLQSMFPVCDVLLICMSRIDMATRILLTLMLARLKPEPELQLPRGCEQLQVVVAPLVVAVRSLWSPLLMQGMRGQLAIWSMQLVVDRKASMMVNGMRI